MGRSTRGWRTAILAAAILLVLVSGCSSLAGHSVTGTWKMDTSQGATSAITVMTFRADGTGSYKADITTPGLSQMDWHISYPFTWQVNEKDSSGSYLKKLDIVPDQQGAYPFQMSYYPDKDTLVMPTSSGNFVRIS